jgi:hypothetical protein
MRRSPEADGFLVTGGRPTGRAAFRDAGRQALASCDRGRYRLLHYINVMGERASGTHARPCCPIVLLPPPGRLHERDNPTANEKFAARGTLRNPLLSNTMIDLRTRRLGREQ